MERSEIENIAKQEEERVRVSAVMERARRLSIIYASLKKGINYLKYSQKVLVTESHIEFYCPIDYLVDIKCLREMKFDRDNRHVVHSRVDFSIRNYNALGSERLRIRR
ncbi:hypothetical protein [Rosenbergiella australiborealis]|uniref:hypothetical protein n=1 Tax=Rosenbergiella australiborealis TaxID=1544696 RepID=UPI001F4D574C|nr:hypothetical protein [Rosenbergiella australiborealis]